jgi:adenylylsulfate kinase
MVVWIIGLSGSGKTTLAKEVVKRANKKGRKVVLVDGDEVRKMCNDDLDYSMDDRLVNAQRICKLGKFLDDQGVDVVCSILSIFPETREWNRSNVHAYYEVFIDTPIDLLVDRDSKGIYKKYKQGKIKNVAGMDIDFPIPRGAELVIDNTKSRENLLNYAELVVQKFIK